MRRIALLVYLYTLDIENEKGEIAIAFPSTRYRYIKRLVRWTGSSA